MFTGPLKIDNRSPKIQNDKNFKIEKFKGNFLISQYKDCKTIFSLKSVQ